METASEILTESKRQKILELIDELCRQACQTVGQAEASLTSEAVLHDAVGSASRDLVESVVLETAPYCREVVDKYLKNSTNHPAIMQAVACAAEPAARSATLLAIRKAVREQALAAARKSAGETLSQKLDEESRPSLQPALLASLKLLLEKQPQDPSRLEVLPSEVETAFRQESSRLAAEIVRGALTPEMRRAAQRAAQESIEACSTVPDASAARSEAASAAVAAATEVVKRELTSYVKSEAQRCAARKTRQRLSTMEGIEESERREHCAAEAAKAAALAVEEVLEETLVPDCDISIDRDKILELANQAAQAAARDILEPYSSRPGSQDGSPRDYKLAIAAAQAGIGCLLIWLFFLGGASQVPGILKVVLPSGLYRIIYPAKTDGPDQKEEPDARDGDAGGEPAEAKKTEGSAPANGTDSDTDENLDALLDDAQAPPTRVPVAEPESR